MPDRFLCAIALAALLSTALVPPEAAGAGGRPELSRADVPQDSLREDPATVILDQPEAPVTLTAYEADYDGTRLFRSGGIRHEVEFKNASDRRIVAFKLAFVPFSVFNDVIDETESVYLEPLPPSGQDKNAWTHDPPDARTFHIGTVYVEKVRFADGEIWTADRETVESQLDRIDQAGLPSQG